MKLSNKKISRKNKAYDAILKLIYGNDLSISLFTFEINEMLEPIIGNVHDQIEIIR